MTEAGLKDHADALAKLATTWQAKASVVIVAGVDRAHAHSVVALTETLRQTPDGRKTLRKARQSRSYVAALDDLDALLATLCGPSVASLDGLLRDAREAAYRQSFASWVDLFPEAYSVGTDASPSPVRIKDIRGLILHGMDLRHEVGAKVNTAKTNLLAVLEMAARKAVTNPRSADYLGGWKTRSTESIRQSAFTAISDSIVAIESIAGVDAVKPEFRPTNRYAPV